MRRQVALVTAFAASLPGQTTVTVVSANNPGVDTVAEGRQYSKLDNPVKEAPPVVEFFSFHSCLVSKSSYGKEFADVVHQLMTTNPWQDKQY